MVISLVALPWGLRIWLHRWTARKYLEADLRYVGGPLDGERMTRELGEGFQYWPPHERVKVWAPEGGMFVECIYERRSPQEREFDFKRKGTPQKSPPMHIRNFLGLGGRGA